MAGGNRPDPDEIERKLRELNEQIGTPRSMSRRRWNAW